MPPNKRMKEVLEEVMLAISDLMYDSYDWVTEQEVLDELEQKDKDFKQGEVSGR